MLTELTVENFAIIDHLQVRFEGGFTALTGETGAGKSIIIDALQVALGGRATGDMVRGSTRSATIEAIFDLSSEHDGDLDALLNEYGIPGDDSLIVRREINSSGRGTARVNGRAVPLSVLQQAGELLVDIHGQSDHLSVLRRDQQLTVLDRYGDLLALRVEVSSALREFTRLQRELTAILAGARDAAQRADLLRFQVGEIEGAALQPGEEEELHAEQNLLINAERLVLLSRQGVQALQGDTGGVLDGIVAALAATRDLVTIDPALASLDERLQAAQYELADVAQELRRYGDAVEFDSARLATVEDRLDLLSRLKRKYGPTLDAVIQFGVAARAELDDVENFDQRVVELRRQREEAGLRAGAAAGELSDRRSTSADHLTLAMADALQGLGLSGTAFATEVSRIPSDDGLELPATPGTRYSYSPTGVDAVTFLVSFNPGEPLRPFDRVASGGETARFLLALKSVLARADRTPTLIFDEVDAGVGGRHGTVVGERLRDLARDHQVLSITHLPQVAALSDHHLTVVKTIVDGRTSVGIRPLDRTGRVRELAEMMTGTGTDAAQRNAEELLQAGQASS